MKVDIEFGYPVAGVMEGARKPRYGNALFRKTYDVPELDGSAIRAKAFSVSEDVAAEVDRVRNPEGHDVTSTLLHGGRPYMAVNENAFIGEPAAFLDLSRVLNNAVRHRLDARGMMPDPAAPSAAGFARIVADTRPAYEEVADAAMAKFALFRDRVWEADVIPLYAVRGGDRPDVSIVPSSSLPHTFFDHFLPDEGHRARARFLARGGAGPVARLEPDHAFVCPEPVMRHLLVRTARGVVEAMGHGIETDATRTWHRRIGGDGLVRGLKLLKMLSDDPGILPPAKLAGALATVRDIVRSALRLSAGDEIAMTLDLVDDRLEAMERHFPAPAATPAP